MADEYSQKFQFEYKTNSNLVLTPDRSLIERRSKEEPTGAVQPIVQPNIALMGCKFMRDNNDSQIPRKKARIENDSYSAKNLMHNYKNESKYIPSSKGFYSIYEALMKMVENIVPELSDQGLLLDTTEEILRELKKDAPKQEIKNELQSLFEGSMTDDVFDNMMSLSNKLTDYKVNRIKKPVNKTIEATNACVIPDEDSDEDDESAVLMDVVQDVDEDDNDVEEFVQQSNIQVPENILGDRTEIPGTRTVLPQLGRQIELKSNSIDPKTVDAFWLQRTISKYYKDPMECQKVTRDCLEVLNICNKKSELENKLMKIFKNKRAPHELVQMLRDNHLVIYYCTKLTSAQSQEERVRIEAEMKRRSDLKPILDSLKSTESNEDLLTIEKNKRTNLRSAKVQNDVEMDENIQPDYGDVEAVDLKNLMSNMGSHWSTNTKCDLNRGAYRKSEPGYELVHVPPPKPKAMEPDETLINVDSLPGFCKAAFEKRKTLNRIQSKVCKTVLETDLNVLLCAPTGAGKTDVALLAMMREIGKHIQSDGSINTDDFKIIYLAPMKSLVSEMKESFSERLRNYNIKVSMLSGDNNLSRQEIQDSQVIICTPEKWDIITIKAGERTYTKLVKLLIIDEIHLLHDDRGPVIEAIVARTIRSMCQGHGTLNMRIVGLSATLPNYNDVADFIRVDKTKGLFKFDGSYRPVPLEQEYLGITEKSAKKRPDLMNDLVYKKVMEYAGKHQVLIFTHSRRDTANTARAIKDKCFSNDTLGLFLRDKKASSLILQQDLDKVKNNDLKDLLPYGFAIHHAGLSFYDRKFVEDLFTDKHIQVLVSTSTLAWGVNLPAHVVIIKGTQVYNPEKGEFTELSALDVMQMFGRAGRPQYDTKGVGIMITNQTELQYYLSLLNEQLPIESQFIRKLPDNLNAEIVTGNVRNIYEAVDWIKYSYLYIRMRKSPRDYNVEAKFAEDPALIGHCKNLIYTAAKILEQADMINFEKRTGEFQPTELSRIAAHYYCTFETMTTLKKHMKKSMFDIEVFRAFSECSEFKQISVRLDEIAEVKKLLQSVPIPVNETDIDAKSKVNCLLQAYISQLKLDRMTLSSDASFISQSAARLMRALFEFALYKRWAGVTKLILNTCKEIEQRMWSCSCPLRQFDKVKPEVIKKFEKKSIAFDELIEYDQNEISDLLGNQRTGKSMYRFLHFIPKLQLTFDAQTITRNTLKIELSIVADFEWNEKYHGTCQPFWIFVEDGNGEEILHSEYFLLKQKYHREPHILKFFVPIFEPVHPFYEISAESDKWIGPQSRVSVNVMEMLLPDKNLPPTELLDLQRLPIKALRNEQYEELYYSKMESFNSIQTQCFESLYNSDENVFLGTPTGCGKTICAELAIMRLFTNKPDGRVVYVTAMTELADLRYEDWSESFGGKLGKTVVKLTGNSITDNKIISKAHIIVSTADKWDVLSRRWKQRKAIQNINLFIADDLHLIGSHPLGACLEIVCARIRYMISQLETQIRIVGLSYSLTNAKNVGEWLNCHSSATLNFHPSVRYRPLNLEIKTFNIAHNATRINAMFKPVYQTINKFESNQPIIAFCPTMHQTELIALELIKYARADNKIFGNQSDKTKSNIDLKAIEDCYELTQCVKFGIGFVHEALSEVQRRLVLDLLEKNVLQVVVISHKLSWTIGALAYCVIVVDTQVYNGRDCTYDDYETVDLLQMIGRANWWQKSDSHAVIMCQSNKHTTLSRFLQEPLPLESQLDHHLHDHFNAEIVTKTIENKQDAVDYLTWTFLYNRMTSNPNYYQLKGVSHRFLSDHLSYLVEETLTDLDKSKCISIKDDVDVAPINLGMIAAYYYIHYATIEMFSKSLRSSAKVRGLLELICGANEFESLTIRHGEDNILSEIGKLIRYPLADAAVNKYTDPKSKCTVLLQAHLSRIPIIGKELQNDLSEILSRCSRLVQACVDVISSNRWLRAALAAMELAQMLTQAQWNRGDSILRQLPHFDELKQLQERCKKADIDSIFGISALEEEEKRALFEGIEPKQLADIAIFLARYPNIDLSLDCSHSVAKGGRVQVSVQLERDVNNMGSVICNGISAGYMQQKEESWWLVLGDASQDRLISIKLINGFNKTNDKVMLMFDAHDQPGTYKYNLYFMSDSYLGCDQEYSFEVRVG